MNLRSMLLVLLGLATTLASLADADTFDAITQQSSCPSVNGLSGCSNVTETTMLISKLFNGQSNINAGFTIPLQQIGTSGGSPYVITFAASPLLTSQELEVMYMGEMINTVTPTGAAAGLSYIVAWRLTFSVYLFGNNIGFTGAVLQSQPCCSTSPAAFISGDANSILNGGGTEWQASATDGTLLQTTLGQVPSSSPYMNAMNTTYGGIIGAMSQPIPIAEPVGFTSVAANTVTACAYDSVIDRADGPGNNALQDYWNCIPMSFNPFNRNYYDVYGLPVVNAFFTYLPFAYMYVSAGFFPATQWPQEQETFLVAATARAFKVLTATPRLNYIIKVYINDVNGNNIETQTLTNFQTIVPLLSGGVTVQIVGTSNTIGPIGQNDVLGGFLLRFDNPGTSDAAGGGGSDPILYLPPPTINTNTLAIDAPPLHFGMGPIASIVGTNPTNQFANAVYGTAIKFGQSVHEDWGFSQRTAAGNDARKDGDYSANPRTTSDPFMNAMDAILSLAGRGADGTPVNPPGNCPTSNPTCGNTVKWIPHCIGSPGADGLWPNIYFSGRTVYMTQNVGLETASVELLVTIQGAAVFESTSCSTAEFITTQGNQGYPWGATATINDLTEGNGWITVQNTGPTVGEFQILVYGCTGGANILSIPTVLLANGVIQSYAVTASPGNTANQQNYCWLQLSTVGCGNKNVGSPAQFPIIGYNYFTASSGGLNCPWFTWITCDFADYYGNMTVGVILSGILYFCFIYIFGSFALFLYVLLKVRAKSETKIAMVRMQLLETYPGTA